MAEAAAPQKRIAHYEILEHLGEGGMGVVWKARDTRLNRLAAIKVLPADRMADESRKRRFVQEAQAASALNHPHIVTIYDINSDAGADYIAMEYVAGRALDQLIPRGGMRLNDALKYAVQMADGLAAAHRAGIIHRDLKPGNVMISEPGGVKIVDFGLAKLAEPSQPGESDVTRTAVHESAEGMIVGTAPYMSPEQAEGKPLDRRSDIFSFGLVLYEMITGQRAFQGDTRISTIAAILHHEVTPPSKVARAVPRELDRIVARCLKKDATRRFQDADDLRIALEELKEESESGALAPPAGTAIPVRAKPRWLWPVLAAVCVILAGGFWLLRDRMSSGPPARLAPLTAMPGTEYSPTFSPDGSQVAFSWDGEQQNNIDIYVKLVDGATNPLRLTTAEAAEFFPSWSPDGRWIAYYRMGSLYVVSPLGGQERRLADVATALIRIRPSWTPDSKSIIIPARAPEGSRLTLVSVSDGQQQPLPFNQRTFAGGAISPDGKRVAIADNPVRSSEDLYIASIDGSGLRRITDDGLPIMGIAWTPDSREIVFASDREGGGLWRVAAREGAEPERVPGTGSGSRHPAISLSAKGPGRLAFCNAVSDENIWMADVAPEEVGAPPVLRNATMFPGSNRAEYSAEFSPDGQRVAFVSNRTGNFEVWVAATDGSNQTQLTAFRSGDVNHVRWSPDGTQLAVGAVVKGNRDVYVLASQAPAAPRKLTSELSDDGRPRWSRDGKWIYFRSDRSGRNEVWKAPASGGLAVQVTKEGGQDSLESPDGRTLYFDGRSRGGVWRMPVEGGTPELVTERFGSWGMGPDGLFVARRNVISFYSFKTRSEVQVGTTGRPALLHILLSVSPDGRRLSWSQTDRTDADLMVIENFR